MWWVVTELCGSIYFQFRLKYDGLVACCLLPHPHTHTLTTHSTWLCHLSDLITEWLYIPGSDLQFSSHPMCQHTELIHSSATILVTIYHLYPQSSNSFINIAIWMSVCVCGGHILLTLASTTLSILKKRVHRIYKYNFSICLAQWLHSLKRIHSLNLYQTL